MPSGPSGSAAAGITRADETRRHDPWDLRHRVPAQSLLELLSGYVDTGQFHLDPNPRKAIVAADAHPWYLGAIGERAVAAELSRLPSGWTVLHSVPVGRGSTDIDHVVIGPAGVFTVNTKHHSKTTAWVGDHAMFIGGTPVDYLRKSSAEARRASELLSRACGLTVPVTGVIALVGASRLTIKQRPNADFGVDVVTLERLRDRLQTRREFSDEQIDRIVQHAIRFDTWHTGAPATVDITPALEQFRHPTPLDPPSRITGSTITYEPVRPVRPARSTRRRGKGKRLLLGLLASIGGVLAVFVGLEVLAQALTHLAP